MANIANLTFIDQARAPDIDSIELLVILCLFLSKI